MPNTPWPRRASMDKWIPAEKAIHDAVQEVEKCGADVRLTDIVIKLQACKELLADWAEATGNIKPE